MVGERAKRAVIVLQCERSEPTERSELLLCGDASEASLACVCDVSEARACVPMMRDTERALTQFLCTTFMYLYSTPLSVYAIYAIALISVKYVITLYRINSCRCETTRYTVSYEKRE